MLSINLSELVLTIISFFLLLFLLNKFLYTPVLKFMRERQARIDAGLEKERAANAEAAENEKRIEDAKTQRREEAKAILARSGRKPECVLRPWQRTPRQSSTRKRTNLQTPLQKGSSANERESEKQQKGGGD